MNLLCCCCCNMAPNTRVTRKWELFAGRNKFYCDGLLMSAPHTGVFYLTCILITGTSALFFAFDCPFLATRINPVIPIVGAVLYFFTMSSLLRTTFTDPGVIPRASHDEAAYIEKQIEVSNSLNSPTYRPPPRTKEVLVKGQTVKLKYCFTCKIFRPPRASHCSLCDNCVDRFDHHCPWVGNCVGKRNYRFFYSFLVSLAFLAVFIFSCSVTHLVLLMKTEQEVFEVIKKAPFTVIVVFICFFSIWSVIGLAGFHTYLTTSDQTTNEDLKGSFSSKGGQRSINPYSRGNICLNCCHILCGPMTPSLIDRRGIATDEYIIQMQQPSSPRHPLSDVMSATHVGSSGMTTAQPMLGGISVAGGGISIGGTDLKPRLYDESNPSSSTLGISGGVYRPRSYDNLQNGNSNSLAHLVDNEIPLAQMDIPHAQSTQTTAVASMSNGNTNALPNSHPNANSNMQLNLLSNVPPMRQFRHHKQRVQPTTAEHNEQLATADLVAGPDIVDDDEVVVVGNTEVVAAVSAIAATNKARERHNRSASYNNLFIVDSESTAATTPTTPTTPMAPSKLDEQTLPNIEHFYKKSSSGLLAAALRNTPDDPRAVACYDDQQQQQQHQLSKSISQTENMYSNVPNNVASGADAKADTNLHVYSNLMDERHQCTTQPTRDASRTLPSTLLSDDLDLDDPMTASFVTKNGTTRQYTSDTLANGSASNSKHHTNRRKVGGDQLHLAVTPVLACGLADGTPNQITAAAPAVTTDLTPSKLRLLHDTTMIDTALDLDSLDGTSLEAGAQQKAPANV